MQVSCTITTMLFYIQIIIRSRLDQSVEENQDLKVRGEREGLGQEIFADSTLLDLKQGVGGQQNGWHGRWSNSVPIFSCMGTPSLQECRHLLPWDHNPLTQRALTIHGCEVLIVLILAVNKFVGQHPLNVLLIKMYWVLLIKMTQGLTHFLICGKRWDVLSSGAGA